LGTLQNQTINIQKTVIFLTQFRQIFPYTEEEKLNFFPMLNQLTLTLTSSLIQLFQELKR